MSELKSLSNEAIPAALEKAERYRLLNEPGEAESICLDILKTDSENQQAIVTLVLALTDRFEKGYAVSDMQTKELLSRMKSEYDRAYYTGIVAERRAKVKLRQNTPDCRFQAYDLFREAMSWFEKAEPDPVMAAAMCERAGAQGIVTHLRSDRRHIQDRDIDRLRQNIMTKLNLEMGNTPEIVDVALRIVPDEVCLVPEKREEVTTEGGLDVIANRKTLEPTIKRLHTSGIRISLFIDPTLEQVDAAAELGVEMVELHTGGLANAFTEKIQKEELEQLRAAARAASESNLQVNAGHGINYKNIKLVSEIPCFT